MNLAILHYHLNRSGVTRVIENQIAALDAVLDPAEPWNVALFHGGRRPGWDEEFAGRLRAIRLSLVEVPLLEYDDVQPDGGRHGPADLLVELYVALGQVDFEPDQTIMHLHNHSLGRNRCLPEVAPVLARDGYAVLLQIHDFAEDFRPGNYRCLGNVADVYQQAANMHYAVLNGRDQAILRQAGARPDRLHRLPNPVPHINERPPRADARRRLHDLFDVADDDCYVLYPIRGIRRKNLGEALLYSALAPPKTIVGVTLPPLNPVDLQVYEGWKELAAELDLPCRFGVGAPGGLSFSDNIAAADLIITTSLAEGFGMVFLESWLADCPLIGRDLPEITPDFIEAGLRFDWLRPQLRVPLEWIGVEVFRRAVVEAYRRTLDVCNRVESPGVAEQIEAKVEGGLVDFGDLDETMQQTVIRIICDNEEERQRIHEANPWLEEVFAVRAEEASEVIGENVRVIARGFSLEPSGRRLLDVYQQVAAGSRDVPPEPLSHPERILDQFLDLARFRLIRS